MDNRHIDEKKLFSLFKDSDIFRPFVGRPYEVNDKIYIASKQVFLCIDKKKVSNRYPTYRRREGYPNVRHGEENCNILFLREDIKKAIDSIPLRNEVVKMKVSEPCKECDGSGMVEWEYTDSSWNTHMMTNACPICEGNGLLPIEKKITTKKMIPDPTVLIALENELFSSKVAKTIYDILTELGEETIICKSHHNGENILFTIGDYATLIAVRDNSIIDNHYIEVKGKDLDKNLNQ
jgi:hypothetical protein